MKRVLLMLSAVLLLVSGCKKDDSSAGTTGNFKPVTLRYATQHTTDNAAYAAAEAIKEEVEAKTQGRVKITIYPANQLGDWTQVYDEVMMGTIDIAHTTVPETYDARIGAGFLPFLARDYNELDKVMAEGSYLTQTMEKLQKEFGIHFFGYYCEGFMGIGTTKPIKNADKIGLDKGVLIRVPGNDAFKFPVEYLGFRTSTIPYADTFAAIQTGVVDGWLGGPPNLNYLNFRDVIKYYYHYNVVHEATQIYMSDKVYQKLLPEDQKVLDDAVRKQTQKSVQTARDEDEKYMRLLEEHGIQVIRFDDSTYAKMASEIRKNVWDKLAATYSKEFLDALKASYN